ncbi:MAG: hypothetical protein ACC628_19645 [Pirellulaceae bacterium]
MSPTFDPYYEWLGIPPKHQPPNHYRLLGIELFEENVNVIERAADRQMAHVRTYQAGKHAKRSQCLLNEISSAKICLLEPSKKSHYDAELQAQFDEAEPQLPEPVAEVLPATSGFNINLQQPPRPRTVPSHTKRPHTKRRARRTPWWAQPAFLGTVAVLVSVGVLLALIPFLTSRGNRSEDGEKKSDSDSAPYELPDFHGGAAVPSQVSLMDKPRPAHRLPLRWRSAR